MSKTEKTIPHSSAESETMSMSRGLRAMALPGLDLMEAINTKDITELNCHEDNEATIAIIKSGKNPTMKHMNRTHGVQVRALYDEFNKPRRNIKYIESAAQRADILTKCFGMSPLGSMSVGL